MDRTHRRCNDWKLRLSTLADGRAEQKTHRFIFRGCCLRERQAANPVALLVQAAWPVQQDQVCQHNAAHQWSLCCKLTVRPCNTASCGAYAAIVTSFNVITVQDVREKKACTWHMCGIHRCKASKRPHCQKARKHDADITGSALNA